jgi:hypothetical protein
VFWFLVASAVAVLALDVVESILLVLWRLGERWSRHRKEPACVVGEHRQLLFAALGCLVIPDRPDISSASDGISTFISLLAICSGLPIVNSLFLLQFFNA